MDRAHVLLGALAHGAESRPFRPVHVQKIMFLLEEQIPDIFDERSRYHFTPYDYGPFDAAVYHDLERLERSGDVEIDRAAGDRYREYRATPQGIQNGNAYLEQMDNKHREFLKKVVDVVLPLGFRQLVTAIYRAFPKQRENSVFKY